MGLSFYLKKGQKEPFPMSFHGEAYKLPNLNSLDWETLEQVATSLRFDLDWLRQGKLFGKKYGIPDEVIDRLSTTQLHEIARQWHFHAGVLLGHIGMILKVVEDYDTEFSFDLHRFTNIHGIKEFLTLPLVEAYDLAEMIARQEPASYTNARIAGLRFPLTWDTLVSTDVVYALLGKNANGHTRLQKATDMTYVDSLITQLEAQEANEATKPHTPDTTERTLHG